MPRHPIDPLQRRDPPISQWISCMKFAFRQKGAVQIARPGGVSSWSAVQSLPSYHLRPALPSAKPANGGCRTRRSHHPVCRDIHPPTCDRSHRRDRSCDCVRRGVAGYQHPEPFERLFPKIETRRVSADPANDIRPSRTREIRIQARTVSRIRTRRGPGGPSVQKYCFPVLRLRRVYFREPCTSRSAPTIPFS